MRWRFCFSVWVAQTTQWKQDMSLLLLFIYGDSLYSLITHVSHVAQQFLTQQYYKSIYTVTRPTHLKCDCISKHCCPACLGGGGGRGESGSGIQKSGPFLGAFAKLRKATISFVMSVYLHGTSRFPMDGFWWNFIFGRFSKLYRENLSFIKIRQEYRLFDMVTSSTDRCVGRRRRNVPLWVLTRSAWSCCVKAGCSEEGEVRASALLWGRSLDNVERIPFWRKILSTFWGRMYEKNAVQSGLRAPTERSR
jgi:hypothetical protein